MISVLLWLIYLCGVLVAAAGAAVAGDLFSERGVPFTARAGVIVFAGVLWPVLLVGLLQLVCIAGLAAAVRTASAAQHVDRRRDTNHALSRRGAVRVGPKDA
jgi:predicted anti-sigma-YlaC factor YlaD